MHDRRPVSHRLLLANLATDDRYNAKKMIAPTCSVRYRE